MPVGPLAFRDGFAACCPIESLHDQPGIHDAGLLRESLWWNFALISAGGRSAVFLQVEGAENGRIKIDGGDLSKAASALAFRNGATAKAVELRA
jgi:hypothetical protein